MVKYLFSFLFCFTFYSVDAQKRLKVSINAGLAIPTGDFSRNDIFDSASAFAKTGPSFDIALGYRFSSLFGAEMLMGGQQNPVNVNDVSNKLANIAGTGMQFESGKWKMYKIMIGLDFEKPIDQMKRLFFTSRILAGVSSIFTSNQRTNQTVFQADGSSIAYGFVKTFQEQMPYKFASQLGIGLSYFVYHSFFVKMNLDCTISQAEYSVYPYRIYVGTQLYKVNTSNEQLIAYNGNSILLERSNNIISTTIGAGVSF